MRIAKMIALVVGLGFVGSLLTACNGGCGCNTCNTCQPKCNTCENKCNSCQKCNTCQPSCSPCAPSPCAPPAPAPMK